MRCVSPEEIDGTCQFDFEVECNDIGSGFDGSQCRDGCDGEVWVTADS